MGNADFIVGDPVGLQVGGTLMEFLAALEAHTVHHQVIVEMIMRVSEELLPYSQQVADESNADDLQFLQEQGMTFIDFDQIDGMREFLRDATLDKAIERMKESIDPELLDAYLKAAGYSS